MENPLPSPSRRSELIYELMMMMEIDPNQPKPSSKLQHLANTSKGKKHIIGAPSKKVASLGTGDSSNPIGKKLPTKPTQALKRKRSDTHASSLQNEAIPTSPTISRII
ncbi:hypothetical protein L1987_40023 [Smallanthus sonchifolius]|uniref:Uncharacterized protein n=1 Tax=Smallanthus sonchifolius TaxID=185202 RepID=A0ACB9GRY1_9ASTR|nr:hypothetical protein L1987_40023 [Smallanthus sonchifolius]